MKITYEVIKLKAQKHIKCAICGKWITRSKMFEQILNPWNKTSDGFVKSREEIMAELHDRAKTWETNKDEFYCKNCEEKKR